MGRGRATVIASAFALAWGPLLSGGCTLLVDTTGLTGGGSISSDAGASEGGPDAKLQPDAGDAAPPARDAASDAGELHPAGRFEQSCEPWGSYRGQLTWISPGRSSAGACRACGKSPPEDYTADDTGLIPAVRGEAYEAEAWLRRFEASTNAFVVLRGYDASKREVETSAGPVVRTVDSWTRATARYVVKEDRVRWLNVFIVGDESCFDFDDVSVRRVTP